MTNRTTILIAILFLITCGLLYIAIVTTSPSKKVTVAPTPTPMSVNAKSNLSLVTASASESSKIASRTVAVTIDTTNNVNAVQIELTYDPQKVTNVTLSPGKYFQQPNVLLKNIDTNNGRISYALAEQLDLPGKSGKGTVALISFDLTPSAKPATTTIKFLPKTAVTADKILETVLRSTKDITLPLPVASPTGSQSSSSAQ